jgi:putative tricarboxylic transport membrane protein
MADPLTPPHPLDAAEHADERRPPRADGHDAVGWIVLGVAVLAGSLTMDRLERQHINPYTAPGLLPGLLGIAMILLGGVLALRSVHRGALHASLPPAGPAQREERLRIAVVTALCVGYGVVLIGHGLPFWVASTIYVTGSILVLQRIGREPDATRSTWGGWVKALVIGLGASLVTQGVFQELFLVRLP